jgi:ComF family protein
MNWGREFCRSFASFFFPPLCLHCEELLELGHKIFCATCSQQLEFVDLLGRCTNCFAPSSSKRGLCSACLAIDLSFDGLAAALPYIGPAASLVKKLKYEGQPYLAEAAGALLVVQWNKTNWPIPDLIVPAPITFLHRIFRGYNQSYLLAKVVGKLLDRPVKELLVRKESGWRQAGQSRRQRRELKKEGFLLKSPEAVRDKTILLIDDVLTTSTTMRCAASALATGYPKATYGLCLCSS